MAMLFFMFALSLAVSGTNTAVFRAGNAISKSRVANAAATAGIDKAIWCLNAASAPADCGGSSGSSFTGENVVQFSGVTYTSTVTNIDPVTKQIDVIAYAPNATNPISTQHLRASAIIDMDHVSFNYALQTGIGGLEMEENSAVTGNVYSNGNVEGHNGSTVSGDIWVAGGSQRAADQQSLNQNGNLIFGKDSTVIDPSQSFTPATTGVLNSVTLYLKKTGAPSNKTVRIVSDGGNKPSKTSLASATLDTSLVTTNLGWISIPFQTPPNLSSGTRYWIVVDSSTNATNYLTWGADTANGYAGGKGMSSPDWNSGNPTWNEAGSDLAFKAWMGGVATHMSGIDVTGSVHANTISSCSIAGDAYYQVKSGCSVTGTSVPGSADPGPAPYPISDAQIAQWKEDAIAGGTISGNYAPSGSSARLGPQEITGDLTLTNNATLTMTGTLYIHGNLEVSNNGIIRLDPSFGGNGGVIVVDGAIVISNNGRFVSSGAGSYILAISTMTDQTVSAITLSNNVNGAIFFAPYGKIDVDNNTIISGLMGDKVHLANNATLIYTTGMADARFSSGPGGSWTLNKGTWREVK